MTNWRPLLAIVLADLRDRSRSPRLWLVLALLCGAMGWSFPSADAGYLVLGINGHWRARYSSAWVGMVVAMLSVWLSLLGFYVVRNNITRDMQTRVWQLLVATTMSRRSYLAAKWLSNWLLLCLMGLACLVVAAVLQQLRAEDPRLDVWELVKPLVLIGFPSLAFTAACAVYFDVVPGLSRTVGNLVYFALWVALLVVTVPWLGADWASVWPGDPRGMLAFQSALRTDAAPQLPQPLGNGFCLACGLGGRELALFSWPAWQPSVSVMSSRLVWLLVSAASVLALAPWLDRAAARAQADAGRDEPGSGRRLRWLDLLLAPAMRSAWGLQWAAEVQCALRQRRWPWWLALLAAAAIGGLAPLPVAVLGVVAVWLLMLDIHSHAYLREREARTEAVVYSAQHGARRVLWGRWAMLVSISLGANAPALLRFAFTEPTVALAIVVVSVSLAAWALALGAITGTARSFEVLTAFFAYLALSKVGVLNVGIDPSFTNGVHLVALPLALAALWLAARQRRR